MKNKKNLILLLILILASFLRIYFLFVVPPSASLDEASIGYNAYSILKTGADEYGNKFPLLLRAYDDWRPALYVYLVIPFVQFLGLNVLSVRLPSALLSVLTVIATYFITKELLKKDLKLKVTNTKKTTNLSDQNSKYLKIGNWEFGIPIISSALLAISPWHIYISRLGHEANAGLAFFVFALLFFLKKRIYLSFIFFTLSFISYQSEKIFIPLFVLLLFYLFWKEILAMKKKIVIALIVSLIILIPFIKATLSPNALIRFNATSIFNNNNDFFNKEVFNYAKAVESNDFAGKFIHNRRIAAAKIFFQNYISHFNPIWLFSNFSNDKHKAPDVGLLYIWELPLIIIGLLFLLKGDFDSKIKKLIIAWIFIAPIPGAVTTDAPHAMRIYTMLPAPQILSALGAIKIISYINSKLLSKIFSSFLILLFIGSFIYFYNQYFQVFPKSQSSSFQYALFQAIPFVLENQKSYKEITFSNRENLFQSYMFFLFYSRYDPKLYQKQGGTISGGFEENHSFDKYSFRNINWNMEKRENDIMYIGNINDFPKNATPEATFKYLDGEKAILILN